MAFKSNKVVMTPEETLKSFFKVGTELVSIGNIRLGLYGDTKVGKTHFILGLPETKFIIDIDGNVKDLISKFPQNIQENTHVFECSPFNPVSNILDYDYVVDRIEECVKVVHSYIKGLPEDTPKGFIIIDSATELWEYLGFWLSMQTDLARSKNTGKMVQTEWGRVNTKYKIIMDHLVDTGWHIILNARSDNEYSESGARLGATKPKWQKNTPAFCNVVAEMTFNGVDRTLTFDDVRFSSAQFISMRGVEVKNPTWESMVKTISDKTKVTFDWA